MAEFFNMFELNPWLGFFACAIIIFEVIVSCWIMCSFKNIKGHEMAHASAAINNGFRTLIVYPKAKEAKLQYYTVEKDGLREYFVTKKFFKDVLGITSSSGVCFYEHIPNEYTEVHRGITMAGASYSKKKADFIYWFVTGINILSCFLFYIVFYVSISQILKLYMSFLVPNLVLYIFFVWVYTGCRPWQLRGLRNEIEKARRENRKIKYSMSDGTKIRRSEEYAKILKDIELERLRNFEDIERLLENIPNVQK